MTLAPSAFAGDYRKWLALAIVATLAARLWLAAATPMTGDEAYFIVWGRYLDYGFYDHPPMVGWIFGLLLKVSDAEIWLRLPVILLPTIVAWLMYRLLSPLGSQQAALAATAFALAPVNALNVLITTDTPLVFFAFASAAAYFLALREGRLAYYAVAGVALGLAFLSKYFSVLLGLAHLAHFLYAPKTRNRVWGFLLLLACAIPFAAINLYWNYTHCWDNLMFNLFNRNKGETFSAAKPLLYCAMLVYLVTPPVLYYAYRQRGQWLARLRATGLTPYAFALAAPLAFFLLLSMLKVVGLHWLLAFYPFLFFFLAAVLEMQQLRRCVGFMAWFTLAHFALIIVFALVPLEAWKGTRQYDGLVFLFRMPEILAGLQRYTTDFHFATEGYTASSILTYHYRGTRVVSVFGAGTQHARQDDILTDYRALDGKNIVVLLNQSPDANAYTPYFRAIDNKAFNLHGYTFYAVFGKGFNYDAYREGVLRTIKNKFYRIPGFLPVGACGFCARYFPDEPCR